MNFPNINPVIASIGPFAVSWYSLSYVVGILLGWVYAKKITANCQINLKHDDLDDFVTWAIVGIIFGGRLVYVIVYDPIRYFANPIDILKTYEGGMSFHGGMLGFLLACYIYTKKRGIRFLELTDICATVAPITITLGRVANFINAELYGRVTDVPWAVIFPYSDYLPRHPSQLYESFLEGVVLFCILSWDVWKNKALQQPGRISGLFLLFYGIFRAFVEQFRQPDSQIGFLFGTLTMGQILCLPMVIFGIYLLWRARFARITANK